MQQSNCANLMKTLKATDEFLCNKECLKLNTVVKYSASTSQRDFSIDYLLHRRPKLQRNLRMHSKRIKTGDHAKQGCMSAL